MAIVWSWAVTPVRSHPPLVLSVLCTIWVPLCWLYHGIWCLYSLPCGFLVPLYILWIPQYHVGYVPLSLLCTMRSWWNGVWGMFHSGDQQCLLEKWKCPLLSQSSIWVHVDDVLHTIPRTWICVWIYNDDTLPFNGGVGTYISGGLSDKLLWGWVGGCGAHRNALRMQAYEHRCTRTDIIHASIRVYTGIAHAKLRVTDCPAYVSVYIRLSVTICVCTSGTACGTACGTYHRRWVGIGVNLSLKCALYHGTSMLSWWQLGIMQVFCINIQHH